MGVIYIPFNTVTYCTHTGRCSRDNYPVQNVDLHWSYFQSTHKFVETSWREVGYLHLIL